jgi:hypothetical protein
VGDFLQKAWDLSFFVQVFLNIIWKLKSIIFGDKYANNVPTLELLNNKTKFICFGTQLVYCLAFWIPKYQTKILLPLSHPTPR